MYHERNHETSLECLIESKKSHFLENNCCAGVFQPKDQIIPGTYTHSLTVTYLLLHSEHTLGKILCTLI